MGGSNSSSIYNEQDAFLASTQQYSGDCDVSCTNSMNDDTINIINSDVKGSVNVTQTCSVDASCMFNNTMDSAIDVLMKASNSAGASNAADFWSAAIGSNKSQITNVQDTRISIGQDISQHCKIDSVNEMDNTTINVINSVIGQDVNLSQSGDAKGKCVLNSSMSASAKASESSDNQANSGKGAVKKGGKSQIMRMLMILMVVVVAVVIVVIIAKLLTSGKGKSEPAPQPTTAPPPVYAQPSSFTLPESLPGMDEGSDINY